jgi:hypothetical protein
MGGYEDRNRDRKGDEKVVDRGAQMLHLLGVKLSGDDSLEAL